MSIYKKLKNIAEDVEICSTSLGDLDNGVDTTNANLVLVIGELQDIEADVETGNAVRDLVLLENEEINTQLTTLSSNTSTTNTNLVTMQGQNTSINSVLDAIDIKNGSTNTVLGTHTTKLTSISEELESIDTGVNSTIEALGGIGIGIDDVNTELNTQTSSLTTLNTNILALATKMDSLIASNDLIDKWNKRVTITKVLQWSGEANSNWLQLNDDLDHWASHENTTLVNQIVELSKISVSMTEATNPGKWDTQRFLMSGASPTFNYGISTTSTSISVQSYSSINKNMIFMCDHATVTETATTDQRLYVYDMVDRGIRFELPAGYFFVIKANMKSGSFERLAAQVIVTTFE